MQRRDFILLVGSAASLPYAARAQQPAVPVIGFLSPRSPEESAHLVAAFRRGLAETGAVEGRNVAIEYRWALGEYDRLPTMAAEFVQRSVALIVTVGGEPAALAAKSVTASIPIVAIFTADPVEHGLAASLNRPRGNVTGISAMNGTLEAKRLGLLRDLVPRATTLGLLLNPTFPAARSQLKDIQEAAHASGLQIHVLNAATNREIDAAFEEIAQNSLSALIVAVDSFFVAQRDKIVGLAARNATPAIYSLREFAASGGLMSYGIDLSDLYRETGVYAGRILNGTKPADLPIIQPTKFELVINLSAAKALGITPSSGLLSIADELID